MIPLEQSVMWYDSVLSYGFALAIPLGFFSLL